MSRPEFYDYEATRRVLHTDPCVIVGHNPRFSHFENGDHGAVMVKVCQICGERLATETWVTSNG